MTDLLNGEDIAKVLGSVGPVVKCVLLRAHDDNDERKQSAAPTMEPTKSKEESPNASSPREVLVHLIQEMEVDTTPKKSMVAKILGGPFTFLGQYEEEGIVLMIRRSQEEGDDLTLNPHTLQPPFENVEVRGEILIVKVAPTQEVLDTKVQEEENANQEETTNTDVNHTATTTQELEVPTNDEFFLDYTKEEYIRFASRTDIVAPPPPQEEESNELEEQESDEDESDDDDDKDEDYNVQEDIGEDDEDDQVGMMNLIMGQVLRKFQQENRRGPTTQELLGLKAALAHKLGIELPETSQDDCDWDQKAMKKNRKVIESPSPQKTDSPVKSILTRKRTVSADAQDANVNQEDAKRVKFSHSIDQEEKDTKEDANENAASLASS